MRKALIFLVFLLLAQSIQGQTPQLAWDAPANAASAAEAQGLIYTLYVNNGSGVNVTGVTCTGATPPYACVSPVPSGVPTAIGTRLELTAKTAGSGESARSTPFILPPVAPTNLKQR